MSHLNDAFDGLRKRVPTFAYEKKLSRIETLRLAVTYIRFMADLLETLDAGGVRYLGQGGTGSDAASYVAEVTGGGARGPQYPISLHCDEFHVQAVRPSTTFELSDYDDEDDDDGDDDDDDDAATGSCSPGLSCPEDVQEPLELTTLHRATGLVDSCVCTAAAVSNQQANHL